MSWTIRILVLSLIVGLVLSFLDVNPMGILTNTWDTILSVVAIFSGIAEWALPYVLVGAVVVVPLALIAALLRYLRR
jgi:ABC-type proline/glycine betaine transport system permease subunit